MTTSGVGVKLIAAYLGVTPARVRQIIATHQIKPVGTAWKAKMYDATEVIRHAGSHDRRDPGHPR